jgi:hypothetical protein
VKGKNKEATTKTREEHGFKGETKKPIAPEWQ